MILHFGDTPETPCFWCAVAVFRRNSLLISELWSNCELRRRFCVAELARTRKGDATLFHSPSAVFRGRPRARTVDSSPRRRTVRCVQSGEPYGVPRVTERRTAASSAKIARATASPRPRRQRLDQRQSWARLT